MAAFGDPATGSRTTLPDGRPLRLEFEALAPRDRSVVRVAGERLAIGETSARLLPAEACEWFVGVNGPPTARRDAGRTPWA